MSRNKTFNTWEEARIWMCGAIGKRWVKDDQKIPWKGKFRNGSSDMPGDNYYAPFTAIRDEHGDIPEEGALPELDEELSKAIAKYFSGEHWPKCFQLAIAQAVRMSKEEGK